MSNRKELRDARRRRDEAQQSLDAIRALPRHRGAQVVWSNGVVWTREGDDAWRPSTTGDVGDWVPSLHPSAHVASGTIVDRATREGNQRG